MNQIVKKDEHMPVVPVSDGVAVMAMLQAAVGSGASPETLEKLVALQERIMAKQAEMDFNRAMHCFQVSCPPIGKNRTAGSGSFTYDYATLDHIASTIAPIMQKCGLSYSFESSIEEGAVRASCTIKHVGGHSSIAHFSAPIDRSAKMNDMQKTASALSYARRYALILALGLTTGEMDDDGNAASLEPITESQAADLEALITELDANKDGFLRWLSTKLKMTIMSLDKIPAKAYADAVAGLESKRRKPAKVQE